MANNEHLEIIKQSVVLWNKWRKETPEVRPDLTDAKLNGADLSGADLKGTFLINTELANADLSHAKLSYAQLSDSNLSRADLSEANLFRADLAYADLAFANLIGANLMGANLTDANLVGANLNTATMGWTKIGKNDLGVVQGLDTIQHQGPSSIGIDTIYQSKGGIPESFLRGTGMPEDFITYIRSLIDKTPGFYSCFISYSSNDQEFAERLYVDLQNKGVRCWFAPEDLRWGKKLREGIDESIRKHDRLLLILSQGSISSNWIEHEVESALAREHNATHTIVLPLRLDDSILQINIGWPAFIKNTRNIGNFRKWKDPDSYQKAFDRLVRDLKIVDE
ncbi:MAG: toll/interleukin-1 receptor domain-containing protein [Blastocatellia bacterium]